MIVITAVRSSPMQGLVQRNLFWPFCWIFQQRKLLGWSSFSYVPGSEIDERGRWGVRDEGIYGSGGVGPSGATQCRTGSPSCEIPFSPQRNSNRKLMPFIQPRLRCVSAGHYYLYDNLGYRSLSQTKRKIYIFLFIFFEERICRVDSQHVFIGFVFWLKIISGEFSHTSCRYVAGETTVSTTSDHPWRGRKLVKTNSLNLTTKSRRVWHRTTV